MFIINFNSPFILKITLDWSHFIITLDIAEGFLHIAALYPEQRLETKHNSIFKSIGKRLKKFFLSAKMIMLSGGDYVPFSSLISILKIDIMFFLQGAIMLERKIRTESV